MAERDLYLHEVVDIVGQGQYDYMAHAAREPTNAMPDMLTLQGTVFVCAVGGGRWPQVVNLWDVGDVGWDGWVKGAYAPEGVYVYLAEIRFLNGAVERFSGGVTVVR